MGTHPTCAHEAEMVRRRLVILVVRREASEPKTSRGPRRSANGELIGRIVGHVQHSRLDEVLAPAFVARRVALGVRLLGQGDIRRFADAVETERMRDIQLRILPLWVRAVLSTGGWKTVARSDGVYLLLVVGVVGGRTLRQRR